MDTSPLLAGFAFPETRAKRNSGCWITLAAGSASIPAMLEVGRQFEIAIGLTEGVVRAVDGAPESRRGLNPSYCAGPGSGGCTLRDVPSAQATVVAEACERTFTAPTSRSRHGTGQRPVP